MKYRMPIKNMISKGVIYPDESAHAEIIFRDIEATLPSEASLDKFVKATLPSEASDRAGESSNDDEVRRVYTPNDLTKVGQRLSDAGATLTHFLNAGGMSTLYIAAEDLYQNVARKTGRSIGELKEERQKIGTLEFGKKYETNLLNRLYACKFILDKLKENESTRLRFQREGELLKRINHPCVPRAIYTDTEKMLITLYPQTVSLKQIISSASRPARQRAEIAKNAIGVLADVHDQSKKTGRIILHRDWKPHNILCYPPWISIENLVAFVIDWGLVSPHEIGHDTSQVTSFDLWEGTPVYFAPEESFGGKKAYTERSEVYVAAAVLWEAIVGSELPYYDPKNHTVTISNIQEMTKGMKDYRDKLELTQYNKFIPKELDQVIAKAMSIMPRDRFPTMREFNDELSFALTKWPLSSPASRKSMTTVIPYEDIALAQFRKQKTMIFPRPGEGGTLYIIQNPTLTQEPAPDAEIVSWPDETTKTPQQGIETRNGTEIVDMEDFTPTIIAKRPKKRHDIDSIKSDTSAFDLSQAEQDKLMPPFPDDEDSDKKDKGNKDKKD